MRHGLLVGVRTSAGLVARFPGFWLRRKHLDTIFSAVEADGFEGLRRRRDAVGAHLVHAAHNPQHRLWISGQGFQLEPPGGFAAAAQQSYVPILQCRAAELCADPPVSRSKPALLDSKGGH